jgi:hypothetical protein
MSVDCSNHCGRTVPLRGLCHQCSLNAETPAAATLAAENAALRAELALAKEQRNEREAVGQAFAVEAGRARADNAELEGALKGSQAALASCVASENALRAQVEALRTAMGRIAIGGHRRTEYPDHPMMWTDRFDCVRCGGYGQDVDGMDHSHKDDCPVRIARTALTETSAERKKS